MALFRLRVWSMSASYTGYKEADSKQKAIEDLRSEYRRKGDNRAGWNISAIEVDSEDEE